MKIFNQEILAPLLWSLEQTQGVEQMREHHPEGDVFTHSLQVLHWAFRETHDTDLILAAMLHDVGKVGGSKHHPSTAVRMLDCHCSAKTLWLIHNHMRAWDWLLGRMRKYKKCLDLANHPWLPELMQLCRWDHLGRDPSCSVHYNPMMIIDRLNRCALLHFHGPASQILSPITYTKETT